jgi:hypothetical protein
MSLETLPIFLDENFKQLYLPDLNKAMGHYLPLDSDPLEISY